MHRSAAWEHLRHSGGRTFLIWITCRADSVQLGTGAIAPPGADTVTPRPPLRLGPRDEKVNCTSDRR